MTLVYVCACMLTGRGPMVILYASILLCLYDLYVGEARYASLGGAHYTQWVGPVIFSVWGPLCECGQGLLHSLGMDHYVLVMYGM